MQLKLVTPVGNFRFNATGELIPVITEPFVLVDIQTREQVECLYDRHGEHLLEAFSYGENGQITGLNREKLQNAIQEFMLYTGAWYFEIPEPPENDVADPVGTTAAAPAGAVKDAAASVASDTASAQPSDSAFANMWSPTEQQQLLLNTLASKTKAQLRLEQETNGKWDQQLQGAMTSIIAFNATGVAGDALEIIARGKELAKNEINQLIEQARASQIPENVITATIAESRQADSADGEDVDDGEELEEEVP